MKVNEIFVETELNEGKIKNAMAAGALGVALASNPHSLSSKLPPPAPVVYPQKPKVNPQYEKTAEFISRTYNVDPKFALKVVELAHKYAKPTFPTAKDILAIAAIESSFDPKAVSGLRYDPAVGLLQIRPRVWGLNREKLENNITEQIKTGAEILHLYYKKLHNKEAAVAAYNIGLTDFLNGRTAEGYIGKFKQAMRAYDNLTTT